MVFSQNDIHRSELFDKICSSPPNFSVTFSPLASTIAGKKKIFFQKLSYIYAKFHQDPDFIKYY